MSPEILKTLKITVLIQFVMFLLFGILLTFFVDFFVGLFNWPGWDLTAGRYIGIIYLCFAFVSFLVYREDEWEKIELVIVLDILICVLGAIIHLLGVFLDGTGWAGWLFFAIHLAFFVAFLYFYIQQVKR